MSFKSRHIRREVASDPVAHRLEVAPQALARLDASYRQDCVSPGFWHLLAWRSAEGGQLFCSELSGFAAG
jgi:hypothetical protein